MTFRSPEDDTRPVGWNRGQEHRPRSWGGLCVARPRNRKGERPSAQNRTTRQTEGCWREPRPRASRAACVGCRELRARTPRGLQACAPLHTGLPAGRARFLPGRWLASRRPCPTEPGGSVFTCYRTWPQRCVLSTTVKSPPKFEERGHGPRFSVRAVSGPCCRGARGLGGRVTVTLGK